MDIGALNVRITFQRNDVITDRYGNHTSEWSDYFSCWATASGQTGQETDEAGQTLESDRMNFTVRYCTETAAIVSTGFRIVMGDRIYNILHVDDMAFKKHSLKFMAELVRR